MSECLSCGAEVNKGGEVMGCHCGAGHSVCEACYARWPSINYWALAFPVGHTPWHREIGNVALWRAANAGNAPAGNARAGGALARDAREAGF